MFAANSKHLVVGFGITGLSIVKALARLGVTEIMAIDSRDTPPNQAEISPFCRAIHTGSLNTDLLDECDYLWVSPGVAIGTPALQATIARLPKENVGGDIELFARLVQENIIAITGTNGKSTVTTLMGSIAEEAGFDLYMGGNLGMPALDLWLAYCDRRETTLKEPLFLLELSSFQLETTDSLKADVGVILNLSPDHLDRYRDYQHYVDAKFKLFSQSQEIIIPAVEPLINIALQKSVFQGFSGLTRFALNACPEADYWADLETKEVVSRQGRSVSFEGTKLGGTHNILNIVAAVAISKTFGIGAKMIFEGIQKYEPLAHRSIFVKTIAGVAYYNDSKATNLSSTEAAILGFPERKWVILGGVTKGQDFSPLQTLLLHNVAGVALIGEDYSTIEPHIPSGLPLFKSDNLETALKDIQAVAQPDEIVLFSPACASFDQFKSFEHRGDVFELLVNQLS